MAENNHNPCPLLGDVIKQARTEKDLTREQLAERVGISPRYLASIENNARIPKYGVLYRLIRKLGISANRIFYSDQPLADEELARLISQCSERDQKLILALVNQMLNKPDHQ